MRGIRGIVGAAGLEEEYALMEVARVRQSSAVKEAGETMLMGDSGEAGAVKRSDVVGEPGGAEAGEETEARSRGCG